MKPGQPAAIQPPLLKKSILQLRYRPRPSFFDTMAAAAARLDEYPDWQTDRLHIVLRDFQRRCSVNIRHLALTYDQDSADVALEDERAGRMVSEVLPNITRGNLTRFACRRYYLAPAQLEMSELAGILGLKMFSKDEALKPLLNPIDDLMYVVVCNEGRAKYRFVVGPAKRSELAELLPFSKEHHLNPATATVDYGRLLESYPETSVVFDVDYFQEGDDLSPDDWSAFVATARERIEALVQCVYRYVSASELSE